MKKYVYNIGYNTYEESEYTQLLHKEKYTIDELRSIIHEACVKAIKKRKKEDFCFVSSYQTIHDKVTNILVEDYGFERVAYQAIWSIFGWPSMFDKNSWEGQRDEENELLNKYLLKNGFTIEDDDSGKSYD